MIGDSQAAVVVLLANDAMEAAQEQSARAALLLIDAALTILVTRIIDPAGRKEMAGMLSTYLSEQVEAVNAGGAA